MWYGALLRRFSFSCPDIVFRVMSRGFTPMHAQTSRNLTVSCSKAAPVSLRRIVPRLDTAEDNFIHPT